MMWMEDFQSECIFFRLKDFVLISSSEMKVLPQCFLFGVFSRQTQILALCDQMTFFLLSVPIRNFQKRLNSWDHFLNFIASILLVICELLC